MPLSRDFSWKNYSSRAHILSNKRPLYQKDAALIPLFSDFSLKDQSSQVHILSKKRPLCQKYPALVPEKKPKLCKNTLVSCHFFPLFEIITAPMPIFYKRNVHSQKYRVWFLYYFPIFHEKTTSLMPYFVGKTSTCKKQPALMHFFS